MLYLKIGENPTDSMHETVIRKDPPVKYKITCDIYCIKLMYI